LYSGAEPFGLTTTAETPRSACKLRLSAMPHGTAIGGAGEAVGADGGLPPQATSNAATSRHSGHMTEGRDSFKVHLPLLGLLLQATIISRVIISFFTN
jgi:hypothetical protein